MGRRAAQLRPGHADRPGTCSHQAGNGRDRRRLAGTIAANDGDRFTRADLEAALTRRTGRPDLVVVDLGMPRNVEPDSASLDGLVLLDMDDLRAAVADALTGRQEEVEAATGIVSDEVERYRAASRARDAAPMVSALRSRVEAARLVELDRQRSKRSDLDEVQWEQVDAVTRAMVAKLLHQPTVVLKEAAGTPRGERLVESLRALFDL